MYVCVCVCVCVCVSDRERECMCVCTFPILSGIYMVGCNSITSENTDI